MQEASQPLPRVGVLCLCSPHGRKVERFVRLAYQAIKANFVERSPESSDLVAHRVAMVFEGQPSGKASPTVQRSANVASAPIEQVWRHASLVYRKPYRITWQVLDCSAEVATGDKEAQLLACNQWQTMYELAFSLS